mmetsp:Transcript_12352/g.22454  ORF Transcript_12352/g.22454 Transcript_12352/m.22454 type:complete len:212 (+) Transcript_12352:73-708(+)
MGSTVFHGTMRWWAELCDELPMLAFGLLLLVALKEAHPATSGTTGLFFYSAITFVVGLATVAYVYFQFYEIFLHTFTAIVVVATLISFTVSGLAAHTPLLLYFGLAEIVGGKLVWSLEHQLCGFSDVVIPYLHVVWHLSSAMAAYHYILFIMRAKFDKFGHTAIWLNSSERNFKHKLAELEGMRFQPAAAVRRRSGKKEYNSWSSMFASFL